MRIYFCDLCNESVPQSDLDHDRAVQRKGRVVCANCEAAMSGVPRAEAETAVDGPETAAHGAASPGTAGETAPPQRSGSGAGAAVGVGLASVALMLAVGTTVFLFDRMERQNETVIGAMDGLRTEAARSERRLDARLDNRFAELSDDLDVASRDLTELRARVSESATYQRQSVEGLRDDLTRLSGRLGDLERVTSDIDRHERELSKVADTVAGLHADVLRLGDRLIEVQDAGQRLAAAAAAEPEEVVEEQPAWWPILAELASQNSGARWGAVQALGDTRDPAVAEFLAPMLKDPDIFVRMATARILGDLEAPVGIPALIDALEDREPSVREAAVVSLRSITGRNLRFDPTGKEAERAKKVKAWREWWEKSRDDILGGDGVEGVPGR